MTVTTSPLRAKTDEPPLRLVHALCTLCGVEDAEPIAVGEDFEYRTCPDEFLAVRCRRCSLVYLNPRPADTEAARIYPNHYHAFAFQTAPAGLIYRVRRRLEARRLLKWCEGLPDDARILDVGCGEGFHLGVLRDYGRPGWSLEGLDSDERATRAGRAAGIAVHRGRVESVDLPPQSYHLILLIMTVEHLSDPLGTLRCVVRLLAPGGRVVVVTDNVASPDFALFGGRHWGGFHFPRHTYLFSKATLRTLAEKADLTVDRLKTAMSPVNWVYSVRNWLDDRRAPRWLVNGFSLKSAPALAAFTLVDLALSLIGRGAVLHAVLRKPEVGGVK